MIQKLFLLVRSLVILSIMLYLGNLIAYYIPSGVPGSIWGLLLLFLGLTTRVIHLNWIYLGASLLIRFMAVLFVPVSVGIIKYSDLLIEQINILLVPNIVSTCVTLLVIGFLGHYLYQMQYFTHKRKKVIKRRENQVKQAN
ncbi:Antiholin-like protein LrgA [Haemophilus influenzae]|uniref:CidA/LrgA family protein n=1 Tax=Haemophilus influenzae TaxID=727 RepID=UPI000D00FF7A|nr:CidA/LrgA family protein [Haemophilus influenzae]MCK9003503.1 CidA/LrgA family protein [Haemophilus influenzae]MCK9092229.1 CidA/LrgA family protein [Haemophilus influenzae]PRI52435.1 Antiholin-like protein LrgA [Haemophilus influenzae]PRM43147.1 Antiholin-like protein LrgA [Haemophilus influenzae]